MQLSIVLWNDLWIYYGKRNSVWFQIS